MFSIIFICIGFWAFCYLIEDAVASGVKKGRGY